MLKNYFAVAIRNLLNYKLYSLINIGGLAISLAATLLIIIFVKEELSYDAWLPEIDSVYRVEATFFIPGRDPLEIVTAPGPLAPTLQAQFPNEVVNHARVLRQGITVRRDADSFEDRVFVVNPDFFKIFDFPVATGDRDAAVNDSTSVVLTEESALKYFGDQSPIGETLTLDDGTNTIDYTVTGVLQDLPNNTHLDFDMIVAIDLARYANQPWRFEQWTSANIHSYVRLAPGVSGADMEARMDDFINTYVEVNIPGLENMKLSDLFHFDFKAASDIHLYTDRPGNMKPSGDITQVQTFAAIAFFILLIAGINFMNLSTARSMQRAREVSLRKVMGANRAQLVRQHLGEAVLVTLMALVLAVGLVFVSISPFGDMVSRELIFDPAGDPIVTFSLIVIAVTVGILGGIYPASVLSSFRPATVLRSNNSSASGSTLFRTALVFAQFAISVGLITATAIVWAQTLYGQTLDPGFTKENRLTVRGLFSQNVRPVVNTLRDQIRAIPGVEATDFSSDSFPQRNDNNNLIEIPGVQSDLPIVIETMGVGFDYFQTFAVTPVAGRLFSEDFRGDLSFTPEEGDDREAVRSIVVNERALGLLGFATAEEAVGKHIFDIISQEGDKQRANIIGVIRDLKTRSVHFEVSPMMYSVFEGDGNANVLTVAFDPSREIEIEAAIQQIWTELVPNEAITMSHVDDDIDALYQGEKSRAFSFGAFSLFAIGIACLGLFGLASFTAERRTKEIGIRKTMGASISDIVRLMLWQFSKPVVAANLVGWPVALYFMQGWLDGFVFRIGNTTLVVICLVAGALALAIACGAISFNAVRAARTKPVLALKYE